MSVTSAKPDNLQEFTDGGSDLQSRLRGSASDAVTSSNLVRGGSPDFLPTTNVLVGCDTLLSNMLANDRFVQVVHDAVVAADRYDGAGTVNDGVIEMGLRQHGLLDRPAAVAVEALSLYGIAPTSGFVDDPVCAANGNFVHGDEDLRLLGYAGGLSVVRVYNSLAHARRGAFGWGWASVLDCSVALDEQGVVCVSLADGAVVRFRELQDGSYEPDVRRQLTLERDPDGWTLMQGFTDSWSFDVSGHLVAFGSGASSSLVERRDGEVRIAEQQSGRWVRYVLADGVVTAVETGDGRSCTYQYDAEGHLTSVQRAIGRLTYHVQAGLLVAIEDADGVLLCRNSYDEAGRILRQATPHGRMTTYEYSDLGTTRVSDTTGGPLNVMVHDRRGNLTAVIDGDGKAMRLEYNSAGQVARIVDRSGAATRYTYDHRGLLTERIDPDGLSHRWERDELGRLVSETDRAGGTTSYSYEGSRRTPSAVVEPDGATVATRSDDRDLPTEVVDADGVVTRFEWDRDGQLTGIVDGLGHRTAFVFDEHGHLIEARSPSGVLARFTLDDAGRVAETITADGSERFAYTAAGRVLTGTGTDGATWSAAYDDSGEVVRLVDAAGGTLRLGRDQFGNITSFTAPDGAVYRHEYDSAGRLISAIDAAGNTTRLAYDAEGRSVLVADASGRAWRRTIDPLGRTTAILAPDGSTTLRSYHPNGEVASITDGDGHRWQYAIDAAGRVVAVTNPLGAVTELEYTAAGRPLRDTSPMGRVVERTYDRAGRLASVTAPDGTNTAFGRRADGNVTSVEAEDTVHRIEYDRAGRVEALQGPRADITLTWQHDRLAEVGATTGYAAYGWDPRGLLARATDPAGVITEFDYDVRGRLKEQITGDQTISAGYDAAGWLETITDPLGRTTTIVNDPVGQALETHFSDGRGLRYTRGALGQPEAVSSLAGTELARFAYDASGRVVEATSGAGTTRLRLDAVGRVIAVDTPAGEVRYARDADGNLVSREDEDGWVTNLLRSGSGALIGFATSDGTSIPLPDLDGSEGTRRDAGGRILADEQGRLYRYDDAGRLQESVGADGERTTYRYGDLGLLKTETGASGTQRFDYDRAGQLVRRLAYDGTEVTYGYDTVGRRVLETGSDGSSVRYEWDDLDRLVRIDRTASDGTSRTQEITYDGFNRPVVVDSVSVSWDLGHSGKVMRIGEERYLRYGSQVRVASAEGIWSRNVPDDPWGRDGGQGVRLGYRGELALDELVFMGARVYDTNSRCFLSADQADAVPGAVAFAGPYSYAWNDPVNFVDPSGFRPLSDKEYDEIRRRQDKGMFEKAWDAMADDPWGTLAMVGVVAVGVAAIVFAAPIAAAVGVAAATVTAVGSGIVLASGIAAGAGLLTGNFNPRAVALTGALGGIVPGASVATSVVVGAGAGAVYSVADQLIVQGKSITELDPRAVLVQSVIGGISLGAAKALTARVPCIGAADRGTKSAPSSLARTEPSEAIRAFAHGTTPGSAADIATNGLRESAARAASGGGLYDTPGSFHTMEINPANPSEALEIAYGYGLLKGDPVSVVVSEIPESTFQHMLHQGWATVEKVPGLGEQTVFHPPGYSYFNRVSDRYFFTPGVD